MTFLRQRSNGDLNIEKNLSAISSLFRLGTAWSKLLASETSATALIFYFCLTNKGAWFLDLDYPKVFRIHRVNLAIQTPGCRRDKAIEEPNASG